MLRLFFSLSLTIAFVGCGNPKPEVATKTSDQDIVAKNPAVAIHEGKPDLEPTPTLKSTASQAPPATAQGLLTATAPAGGAEAAFQQVLIAFQNGQLEAVYDALPATYQADVDKVVHRFAEKMDAELWTGGFELAAKLANVMKSKKDFILNSDLLKRTPAIESLTAHWDSIAFRIHDAATSEASSLTFLKTCDVRGLLASASSLLGGLPLPKFGEMSVITLTSTDGTATLSYRETKDAEPKEVEFVKVEGKWIPKSIANGWSAGIDDVMNRLTQLPEKLATFKSLAGQLVQSFNASLDKIQQANTADEFNAAFQPFGFSLVSGLQFLGNAARDAAENRQTGIAIRVEINRELKDDEQTRLKDAIIASVDGAAVDYEMSASDGKTRCRFTSMPNMDFLAAVLEMQFEGASIRPNPEAQSIQVELK